MAILCLYSIYCYVQATDELTRLGDYSSVLAVFVITMTTDYFLYKPVMLFNVFCGILVYVNLVTLPNFVRLKVSELRTNNNNNVYIYIFFLIR